MKVGAVDIAITPRTVSWVGPLAVDADGSPRAYAPAPLIGLDALANAGRDGNWWGLACRPGGAPYVQGASDPAPGHYVSTTALADRSRPLWDPRRYVDSGAVPYLSVPPELVRAGCKMGCLALVRRGGSSCAAVLADVGPAGKLGEGSMALARALGLDDSPRRGGTSRPEVEVTVFLGSASTPAWPRTIEDIAASVARLGG
jgi:hypothetical protein